MTSITVLCPNGRRQVVKTNPNTSLLYILEEVCKKQKYDPELHTLKHYRKTLDLSLTVRFANLPNNGLLEMEQSSERRLETKVKIGLQLESGQRLFTDFSSNNSLHDILLNWKETVQEDLSDEAKQPIIIYMRKEIVGVENLKRTNLRMLGLTSGNAILRLIFREADLIGNQAHVSSNLTRSSNKLSEETSNEKPTEQFCQMDQPSSQTDPHEEIKSVENSECSLQEKVPKGIEDDGLKMDVHRESLEETSFREVEQDVMDVDEENAQDQPSSSNNETTASSEPILEDVDCDENIIILGDRDCMLFNLDEVRPVSHDDLPESFFEVNINDVKYLMKELKDRVQELENLPLQTKQMKESHRLSVLHKYKKCYIRIQFPDRLVLQATFRPIETVSAVKDFVKQYIIEDVPFYLYTTPPKVVLDEESRLFELDLVPTAVLHFGSGHVCNHHLRPDVILKISTPQGVNKTAFQSRISSQEVKEQAKSEVNSNKRQNDRGGHASKLSNKVPRWFKHK